jgi:hypothetical protein
MADAKPITSRAATRLGDGLMPYRVNRAASLATMPGIDDSFALPSDERTTWRQLAVAGRLTLWHSGSFRANPASRTRLVWWADVRIGSGVQSIKISEMTYDELKALGVPASQR